MKKIKEFWLIILIALLLIGARYYWHEIRIEKIKSECFNKLTSQENKDTISGTDSNTYQLLIDMCLLKNGITR